VVLLELGRVEQGICSSRMRPCVAPSKRGDSVVNREFKGREELLRLGRQIVNGQLDIALGGSEPTARCRHLLSKVCLFEEGSRGVSGHAHLLVVSLRSSEPRYLASGVYFDRLTKCGSNCWRYASRSFTADGVSAVEFSVGETSHSEIPSPLKASAA
jgi:hypothetical protein